MSSTRYAKSRPEEMEAPERLLACSRLRGINIGMNIVARIGRVLPQAERDAMLWLVNFAALRDVTADALSGELELDKPEIRRALTDPEADRTRFVRQVSVLRQSFEAEITTPRPVDQPSRFRLSGKFDEALRPLANTLVRRKIGNAVKLALREPQIIEVLGKTRMGKSIAGRQEYLLNLHQAAWLHCPKPGPERAFQAALASTLGIATSNAQKGYQIEPKVLSAFGYNRIRLLFVDEGHRLWPSDVRQEPKRIEFLRDLWEIHGVSIVILATPQYSEAMEDAMSQNSKRWAPGQWIGRVMPFDLPETLSDDDLKAVTLNLAPDAGAEVLQQLVEHAKSSEGYAGVIARTIDRARFIDANGRLTVRSAREAQAAIDREARTRALAAAEPIKARRPRNTPSAGAESSPRIVPIRRPIVTTVHEVRAMESA